MRKNQIDFALDMVFSSQAWRDILRQVKGNEITEQTGQEVSSYVVERISDQLSAALVQARKEATA